MRGALNCEAPLCWAGIRYGLQALAEGTVFFPGLDGADLNWTKIVSGQEAFTAPADLAKAAGGDLLLFPPRHQRRGRQPRRVHPHHDAPGPQYRHASTPSAPSGSENGCWLNVGTNGINGRMEIESVIGLRDYPIKLGGGALPFQAYLHGSPKPDYDHYLQNNASRQAPLGQVLPRLLRGRGRLRPGRQRPFRGGRPVRDPAGHARSRRHLHRRPDQRQGGSERGAQILGRDDEDQGQPDRAQGQPGSSSSARPSRKRPTTPWASPWSGAR